METLQEATTSKQSIPRPPTRLRTLLSATRYLGGKALTILVTIFLGVFITMLLADIPVAVGRGPRASQFQLRLEQQIGYVIQYNVNNGFIHRDALGVPVQAEVQALSEKLRAEAGLDLPYLPRYLLWTYKALTFNWGELSNGYSPLPGNRGRVTSNVVLQHLPNTLLLVGTAYLLVFLIGMPFSLYLARHYGGWMDRVLAVLSPISSVPSWVFAMLLVALFAVQLHWLPVAGMFDFHKPTEPLPYILTLLRHMILPVSALVLSLLFQLVYTWRTFFIIYSEEDYVDLARAKGLETRLLEKQYILRPALPYVITSFATSLIGFWQLTVALEKIFQWPGIGLLYLETLPDFWGERMRIGDLMIVVQIVVTFSYLLGILAILLDLAYVILDPRIHLIPASNTAPRVRVKTTHRRQRGFLARIRGTTAGLAPPVRGPVTKQPFSWKRWTGNLRTSLGEFRDRLRLFGQQLQMYPSAIFGLVIIAILVGGSIYAFTALPYEQIGADYDQSRVTGRNLRPRTAAPAWLDVFRASPRLSTLILDEQSPEAEVTRETLENGWVQETVTFQFDYHYDEMPSDVFVYLDSDYTQKIPFASLEWTTPNGRVIELRGKGIGGDTNYDLGAGTFVSRMLAQNPAWRNWFVTGGQYPTPAYNLLFATPGLREPAPQQGTYRLKVTSLLFEENSSIQPQLVLLGHVYGLAGTDYWRRDLTVPLFWGMPFTLIVGFMGTLLTALVAMLLPAIGVWFGGALDTFIQRLTEMNMVLPGLAIAVLAYALLGVHIWVILGVVVVLNALGGPIKSFRSAFLQAKEAPYMETARSYGASNFRIVTRYLVPRILPILIPHLVMQIPTFIFLEATLGFFNIKSDYPSWGRIIYDGLAKGALYGSPFWVLEPIFLLLLTGLAFSMLGIALERILNPRLIADMPVSEKKSESATFRQARRFSGAQSKLNRRVLASVVIALLAVALFTPAIQGRTLASIFMRYLDPPLISNSRINNSAPAILPTPRRTSTPAQTGVVSTQVSPGPTSPDTLTPTTPASCIPANPPVAARVIEMIDGNTVRVLSDGLVYVVRYIGVDSPKDGANAFQAYLTNSELVFRKDVTLIADDVDKDPAGRLLRYVLVGDTFVNLKLLEVGYGIAADSPHAYSCAETFRAAERSAAQSGRGLWAAPTPVPTP